MLSIKKLFTIRKSFGFHSNSDFHSFISQSSVDSDLISNETVDHLEVLIPLVYGEDWDLGHMVIEPVSPTGSSLSDVSSFYYDSLTEAFREAEGGLEEENISTTEVAEISQGGLEEISYSLTEVVGESEGSFGEVKHRSSKGKELKKWFKNLFIR